MSNEAYQKYYSERSFRSKLQRMARTAGVQVVYAALLLYYMMRDAEVPVRTKLSIMAALGYFIVPTDAIPDFFPLLGFSDDLGVLIFALSHIRSHISPEIRERARNQLSVWFKQVDEADVDKVDGRIS